MEKNTHALLLRGDEKGRVAAARVLFEQLDLVVHSLVVTRERDGECESPECPSALVIVDLLDGNPGDMFSMFGKVFRSEMENWGAVGRVGNDEEHRTVPHVRSMVHIGVPTSK